VSRLRQWLTRLTTTLTRRQDETRLREEIDDYVAFETEANLRRGLPPAEARRRALFTFGFIETFKENYRDQQGVPSLEHLLQDVRIALRVLRRAPVFSITAFLILCAGIGLNLTFFHLLNVTTLQPLPVTDPNSLVRFQRRGPAFTSTGVPFPATQFIRQNNGVLAAVLTSAPSVVSLEGDISPETAVAFVSANWFEEPGYQATVGRVFSEAIDERVDAAPAVVISDRFWRVRLGADPQITGKVIRLNGRPATVIGVAPRTFPDLDRRNPQIWLLIHQIDYFEPGNPFKDTWHDNNTNFYARLRAGVSPAAAAAGLRVPQAALAQSRPNHFKADEWFEPATAQNRFLFARDADEIVVPAALIGGLTLLVLLVASANLGNLVLAHAIGRLREFSIRSALGASRWRILRHVLVECGLLAALGGAGGIALAYGAARVLAALFELPPYVDLSPDGRLIAVALAVAFMAMLAFGLVPAWMIGRRDFAHAMKDGGHQTSVGLARARFRLALLGVQVVGCCALLIVAGAMARGLQRLLVTNPGFSFERVAIVDPGLGRHGIHDDVARAYWSTVSNAVADHPAVEQVALVYPTPLAGMVNTSGYGDDSRSLAIAVMHVEPAFFSLLEIPRLSGRTFVPTDDRSVVIISRQVALTMYGTLDVLGKGYPRSEPTRTIVGVVADASPMRAGAVAAGQEYMPIGRGHYSSAVLLAKSRTSPQALPGRLLAAARAADPRVLPRTWLLADAYADAMKWPQLACTIAGLVAVLVLALACLGILGVVACTVKLRAKEIGIRRALGAGGSRVVADLVRQLTWPVAIGMVMGTAAGLVASRLLGRDPFHLAVTDATAALGALAVFAAAALAAAIAPATRALRADPLSALRHE
jgi:predicted permease